QQHLHGRALACLDDVRDEGLAAGWVVGEVLAIPAMVLDRPRYEIRRCVQGEGESRQGPRRQGPTEPLHDLAQVVGAGDPAVRAAVRNLVAAPPRSPERRKGTAGGTVRGVSAGEERRTEDEPWIGQPVDGVRAEL